MAPECQTWGVGLRGVLGLLAITAGVLLAQGCARAPEPVPGDEVEESAVMKAVSSRDAAALTSLLVRGEPRSFPGTTSSWSCS
ncbi:hypothetical protein HUA76_41865 [Myxococcus sp. CA056]|uniref:hypothetical protein n=1 Tax=Myxococcus sp. CA056 TaxID=2741740 RepID=UPI00157A5F9C|nr:hypothetical protein [Myxococcus sp. CA056]NTX17336.1 hypothetical protein [Myxococcus sp. CA056]